MSTFRFADMFRFAGGAEPESESAKILQELRAEALAYGVRSRTLVRGSRYMRALVKIAQAHAGEGRLETVKRETV
jgi:hypothetical protein